MMTAFSHLPSDLVKDIVLRIVTQERQSSISDVALVCRPWHSIVSENLTQILIHKCNGDMPEALSLALRHNQVRAFDVAIELVSKSTSLDDSNRALFLVIQHGQPDLAMLLLTAPHHAAHADCQDGQALVVAAGMGHSEGNIGEISFVPEEFTESDSIYEDKEGEGHGGGVIRSGCINPQSVSWACLPSPWMLTDSPYMLGQLSGALASSLEKWR
eukprot:gene29558-biopygen5473